MPEKIDQINKLIKALPLPKKGLYKLKDNINLDDYIAILQSKRENKTYTIDASELGGSTTGIESLVEGDSVSIDNTDPLNPVISSNNIANSDLVSDADHIWDLDGHSQGIGNIGEYFAIGSSEADGGFLIIPGNNISMRWVDNSDEDTPIYSNQVAIDTKQSQIAVAYNEGVNYAGAVAEKDRFQILVKNATDTATIIVLPEQISIQGVTISNDDIEITGSTKGVILTSPDNTRYRLTVANGGTPVFTAI